MGIAVSGRVAKLLLAALSTATAGCYTVHERRPAPWLVLGHRESRFQCAHPCPHGIDERWISGVSPSGKKKVLVTGDPAITRLAGGTFLAEVGHGSSYLAGGTLMSAVGPRPAYVLIGNGEAEPTELKQCNREQMLDRLVSPDGRFVVCSECGVWNASGDRCRILWPHVYDDHGRYLGHKPIAEEDCVLGNGGGTYWSTRAEEPVELSECIDAETGQSECIVHRA